MTKTLQRLQFSFLTSGPTFHFDVPFDFDPIPDLSTPLLNGQGGRSFDFVPASRDPGIEDATFLRSLPDPDGRSVDLFQRDEPPPLWWLRWHLSNGSLYTHLREEDPPEMAEVTVANVHIVETDGSAPVLLLDLPMQFVASSAPGFQELAVFLSTVRGPDWGIGFQRPGFVAEGRTLVAPVEANDGNVIVVAGLGGGIDLRVWSGKDLDGAREVTDDIVGSLTDV